MLIIGGQTRGRIGMWRFGKFELDVAGRALSLEGQPVDLQPKVFDLLVYLVEHAGRVVSKQELMDHLWPDVHVTESSLQRAVSLVRRALRDGDFGEALKSFAGHGYRLALDQPALETLLPASGKSGAEPLAAARQAALDRNWHAVLEKLSECAPDKLGAEGLELRAFAYECLGRPGDAAPILRDVVDRYEKDTTYAEAARCATTLGKIHLERMEPAVARGWLARAGSLLKQSNDDRARAYFLWMQARFEAFEGRPEAALAVAEAGHRAADAAGDVRLRALTLGYVGFFNISLGHTRVGLEQQDHAAALAMSSAVDPITGGLIYCNILWSCRCFADWSRANQWADGFETWCRANFAEPTGACELHRAEVLGSKGTLAEALAAVSSAFAKLPTGEPWALGDAYRVRGDIRAAIGEVDAAMEDYRAAYAVGWDAEPGHALLLYASGDANGAIAALDRVLATSGWFGLQRRGMILAHKARLCALAGRVKEAREMLDLLTSRFDSWPSPAIHALAMETEAKLVDAQSERSAIQLLALSRQLWTSIGVEHQAARVRLDLAELLADKGDISGARVEIDCAEMSARKVGAQALVQRAQALLARQNAQDKNADKKKRPVPSR